MLELTLRKTENNVVKYYLLAYNVIATLGWSYILVSLVTHLLTPTALPSSPAASTKASNTITRLLSSIPYIKSSTLLAPSTPAQIESQLHPYLVPYFKRAATAFGKVGEQTAWVQTLAVLEIVHALVGFVRSPLATTGMQVFSRLALVWGIAERYEVVGIGHCLVTGLMSLSFVEYRHARTPYTHLWY